MVRKHRKMLSNAAAPATLALMGLIETQSRATICAWCLDYAETRILPIYARRNPTDERPRETLMAARAYLDGETTFAEVKNLILNSCHAAARALDHDPAAQAAARACGQAASVVHTLSHALGLYFYGTAAFAYDTVGLGQPDATYELIADQVCADLRAALLAITVKKEPNPAKIKWKIR